mgnify:CR=1 FL=1
MDEKLNERQVLEKHIQHFINKERLIEKEIINNSIRTDNFKNKVLKISKIVKNLKNYK